MDAVHRDTWFALLVLLIAVVAGWTAFHYASDSSWFPRVLCVFLAVMSMLLLVRSLRNPAVAVDEKGNQVRNAILVFATGVAYALVVQVVSFEIANFLFLSAAMYALGQRNPWVIVGVSIATMLLVKLLFFTMLDVPRPQGVWY